MFENVVQFGKNTIGMASQNKVETGTVFLAGVLVGPCIHKGVRSVLTLTGNSFIGKSAKEAFDNMAARARKTPAPTNQVKVVKNNAAEDPVVVIDDALAERLLKVCDAFEAMQPAD